MPKGVYWKKRMEAIEKMSHDKGADYAEYVKKQFEDSIRAMEKEIEVWYGRIADNNDISLAAAKKLLRKNELEDFHMTVKEYIKKGETLQYSDEWAKQLENASAKVHISRLEALKLQLRQKCEALYGNLENGLEKTMKGIYENGYYHTAYEIMKGRGVGYTFHRIDARRIEKAIDTIWAGDGKNFRARCWTNKEKLTNELQTVLTQSIIRGEAPDKAIKQLAKRMNVSKFSAGRLIMTESAFISSQSQKDCYRELDVEQFEFVATLDSLTSDICREMDGQVFKMSDYEIGVNAPPLHCFCRSCTVPHFEDDFGIVGKRAARKENGETYYIPANMTYHEWKETFVDNGDKSGLQEAETNDKIKTREKDHLQSTVDNFLRGDIDRKTLAKEILDKYNVSGVPVNIKVMPQYGYCNIMVNNGTMEVVDYNLNLNDVRNANYQVKTAFHEAYHASGNGSETDFKTMDLDRWLDIEETFAEISAHYMSKLYGITDLAPSYPDKLVKMLPRLKRLPDFSQCNTITDFGKVAQEFRQNGGGSAWKRLSQSAMEKEIKYGEYIKQYFPEIRKNVSGYVDKIIENMPKSINYKNSMITDLENGMKNVEKFGFPMKDNETMMLNNAVAIAMNRIGVK